LPNSFTVFRWKPGAKARYKKTEVCQTCAKLKNICQTCILDLEYGLPSQARDVALGLAPEAAPVSEANREYFTQQAEEQLSTVTAQGNFGKAPSVNSTIAKLARNTPYYKRNRAHICSFFLKGECTRGDECPYRHEQPDDSELAHQNIKDRYYGQNDPVALKMLKKVEGNERLKPPQNKEITTIYIGGVVSDISEQDLRDVFYAYGEIKSVKMVPKATCAFITFTTREAAEKVIEKLAFTLNIKGHQLKVSWGKPQTVDPSTQAAQNAYPPGMIYAMPPFISPYPMYAPGTGYVMPPFLPPATANQDTSKPYYPSMDPNFLGAKPLTKPAASNPTASKPGT